MYDTEHNCTLPIRQIPLEGSLFISEEIAADGSEVWWLVEPHECQGCTVMVPAHEQLGRMPKRFHPQCVATTTAGRQCSNRVYDWTTQVCPAHRGST